MLAKSESHCTGRIFLVLSKVEINYQSIFLAWIFRKNQKNAGHATRDTSGPAKPARMGKQFTAKWWCKMIFNFCKLAGFSGTWETFTLTLLNYEHEYWKALSMFYYWYTYNSVCYQQKQRIWLGYSKQHGDLVPLTLLVPIVTKINFLLSISIHCQQISYEN